MFGKPVKTSATATVKDAVVTPRKTLPASLISENVTIKGDLASEGDLHLDGAVHGDLRVGQLTVGETGQVVGAIDAESVDIRGRVAGSITARFVKLFSTAQVDGDITHAQLAIEAGAHFEGRSLKYDPLTVSEPQTVQVAEEL